jgi:C4-dicarboxylate-specific signal transduction histidine kinase
MAIGNQSTSAALVGSVMPSTRKLVSSDASSCSTSLAGLSASIAYQVNQPLAAIIANAHACQRWLAADPPNIGRARISSERIVRDANSASDVVNRIRALFKRSTTARSAADINDIVQWPAVVTDIEDEVSAQYASPCAQNRLAQAAQAAGLAGLSASIAYQVNQPLAAIIANAHACQRWLSADPPNIGRARISSERIVRDANSASDVVNRIEFAD